MKPGADAGDDATALGLADFLRGSLSARFSWAEDNCALWAARAVECGAGYDPAADLRGSAFGWTEWRRMIMAAGGLLALIAPRMDRPGLRVLAPCDPGGVAVARVDGRAICGVVLGGRLILRQDTGLRLVDDFETLGAWTWFKR